MVRQQESKLEVFTAPLIRSMLESDLESLILARDESEADGEVFRAFDFQRQINQVVSWIATYRRNDEEIS